MFNTSIRLFRDPISAGTAAILAGSQLLGQGVNAYAQGKMNKTLKQRLRCSKIFDFRQIKRKTSVARQNRKISTNTPLIY